MPTYQATQLHPDDHVAILAQRTPHGATVHIKLNGQVTQSVTFHMPEGELAKQDYRDSGNKIATKFISEGDTILQLAQPIGAATAEIPVAGHFIHAHNLGIGEFEEEVVFASAAPARPTSFLNRKIHAYRRPNGKMGIRNYFGIICEVNCSADLGRFIKQRLLDEGIPDLYPNFDGFYVLEVAGGCGFDTSAYGAKILRRTLAGFRGNPNNIGYSQLGLGCQTNSHESQCADNGCSSFGNNLVQLTTEADPNPAPGPFALQIQENGGFAKTLDRAVGLIKDGLPALLDGVERVEMSLADLIFGLECGGSDGNSAVTANPALGMAADIIYDHGGTCVLAEMPELFGQIPQLARIARTHEVAKKLYDRMEWWEEYAASRGATLDNNPSAGNKLGGLVTIRGKSLGARAKGGTRHRLEQVYEHAEPFTEKGFLIMDGPGLDAPSIVGKTAGGCQLHAFTTGRGSASGSPGAPVIKIGTNTELWERQEPDMDMNAGRIADGDCTHEEFAEEIVDEVVDVCNGKPTKSEALGLGDGSGRVWENPLFHA